MKKIDLDFTALLDIMLILLFVFLLNSHVDRAETEAQAQAQITQYQEKYEQAKAEQELLNIEIQKQEAQRESLQKELAAALSAPNQSVQTWHNYQTLAQKVFFINVTITGPANQLLINDRPQALYISLDQALNQDLRQQKQGEIQELLEREMEAQRGHPFILISAGKDLRIPRLAYTLLWDAVKEIEKKYGPDKVFKTEFYISN